MVLNDKVIPRQQGPCQGCTCILPGCLALMLALRGSSRIHLYSLAFLCFLKLVGRGKHNLPETLSRWKGSLLHHPSPSPAGGPFCPTGSLSTANETCKEMGPWLWFPARISKTRPLLSSSRLIGSLLPLLFDPSSGTLWKFPALSLSCPLNSDSICCSNHSEAFP